MIRSAIWPLARHRRYGLRGWTISLPGVEGEGLGDGVDEEAGAGAGGGNDIGAAQVQQPGRRIVRVIHGSTASRAGRRATQSSS